MAGEDRDDIFTGTVDADNRRVGMLVHYIRSDAAYADTHCPDKDNRVRFEEQVSDNGVDRLHYYRLFLRFLTVDHSIRILFLYLPCQRQTADRYHDDCY